LILRSRPIVAFLMCFYDVRTQCRGTLVVVSPQICALFVDVHGLVISQSSRVSTLAVEELPQANVVRVGLHLLSAVGLDHNVPSSVRLLDLSVRKH